MSATAFARGPFQVGAVVILEEEEAHHLKVRRLSDGDSIRLVDGRGGVATGRLALDNEVLAARVVATTTVPAPAVLELLVGAGDKERFLSLVEKATELGATRIVPLMTERAQTVAGRFRMEHVDKAVRRAREAIKQCGAAWSPTIMPPMLLSEALRPVAGRMVRLLADREGAQLPQIRESDGVQWAVGPEGGFTEAELAQLRQAGFKPVVLGALTLRYDTAAVAALAITQNARLGSNLSGRVT